MKITPEQLNFLNSFSCERLSASKENETLAAKLWRGSLHCPLLDELLKTAGSS